MALQGPKPALNPASAPFFPSGPPGLAQQPQPQLPPPDALALSLSARQQNRLSGSSVSSFRSRDAEDEFNSAAGLSAPSASAGAGANRSVQSSPRNYTRPTLNTAHSFSAVDGSGSAKYAMHPSALGDAFLSAGMGGVGATMGEPHGHAHAHAQGHIGHGHAYGGHLNGTQAPSKYIAPGPGSSGPIARPSSGSHSQSVSTPSTAPSDFSSSSPPPVSVSAPGGPAYDALSVASASSLTGAGASASRDDDVFEARAKASPFLNDILDRLVRNEYTSKEIQRELADVNRRLGLLLSRTLAIPGDTAQPQAQSQSPFVPSGFAASSTSNLSTPTITGSGSGSQTSKLPPPTTPGGTALPASQEEVKQLAHRVNTLTTSVSQLLALQTKAHMQNINASFPPSGPALPLSPGGGPAPVTPRLGVIADTPPGAPPGGGPLQSPAVLSPAGMGFALRDPRPSPRAPGTGSPLRQWSQGPLDLSSIPRDQNIVRQEAMLRGDKRRPSAQLIRRESASTVDTGDWGGGSPREPGPNVTKWDQLPLSLELQHAIVKYGIGPPNKIQQRAVPFLLRGSDIIAQAPPTQERIAAYVIPAIQICLNSLSARLNFRGPMVLIICTTVDQANQGHKMLRDLGGPIGIKVAISTGGGNDVTNDLRAYAQNMPHIICGTPQRMNALFTPPGGGVNGADVRFVVLDEVDQLIARNLHEHVFNVVRLLPPARRSGGGGGGGTPAVSPAAPMTPVHNPFDNPFLGSLGSQSSPFQPQPPNANRRFPAIHSNPGIDVSPGVERQTALFSNTVPQDVLNLANAIQMRDAVRVLVRRDGAGPHQQGEPGATRPGIKNYYLYLAFTAGGRAEPAPQTPGGGLGIIGSGRGATNAETEVARQWKLDALSDLFDDVDVAQAVVYVGGMNALEAVLYRLASKGLEVIPLHGDMSQGQRMAAFQKFRVPHGQRQGPTKALVVYDVPVKAPDVFQVPFIINYDLPKAVEEYSPRVAAAISNSRGARDGVVVNFVTATGGDVEMLRSIECFYKIKCPEVPASLRDVL